MFASIILFLLGVVVSIIITYFVIKVAVRSAIIEAQQIGDAHRGLDRVIKRAILEALEENETQKKSNGV